MTHPRLQTLAPLVAVFILAACADDPSPSRQDVGTGQPDSGASDMSQRADMTRPPDDMTASLDTGSGISEAELANCSNGDTCIVVPYSHCCGSTRKAINAAHEADYNSHPEWQSFNDPDTCAVIGACQSDAHLNSATCDAGTCRLVSACERMFACTPAPADLAANVAATQSECETADLNDMLPAGLRQCIDAAADCDAIAECVNCRTSFAGEFCRTVACPFAVDECLFAADTGQCGIDCDNITGGAIGCFPGYEITCWEQAVDANDCAGASNCLQVY